MSPFEKKTPSRIPIYALFCTLIIIGRFIAIPFPIPITMQLLFVYTGALVLGKKGYIPPLSYLALGIIGVPVFTFGGGLGSLAEPTFGFVFGFVIGAFVTGAISERAKGTLGLALAAAAGTVCVYTCGLGYAAILGRVYFGESRPLTYLFSSFILPFVIPDAIKAALSIFLYKRIKQYIRSQPTDHR